MSELTDLLESIKVVPAKDDAEGNTCCAMKVSDYAKIDRALALLKAEQLLVSDKVILDKGSLKYCKEHKIIYLRKLPCPLCIQAKLDASEAELHRWREREYCEEDCVAKTVLSTGDIGCQSKKVIKGLEASRKDLLDACEEVQDWLDTSSLQQVLVHHTEDTRKHALVMGIASHLERLEAAIAKAEKAGKES